MTKTIYSIDTRLLLCENCGAPLGVPLDGGTVRCDYCGRSSIIEARDKAAPLLATASSATPEQQRLELLRRQDRNTLPGGSQLSDHLDLPKGAEAWQQWQQLRAGIWRGIAPQQHDRFYLLTSVLCRRASVVDNDLARERAVLETALETLRDPRYQQMLCCSLARNAARERDLVAADAWLARCDPRPLELNMDSAYRMSVAYVATARAAWERVLEVLGPSHQSVPMTSSYNGLTYLLRANALERTGQVDAALEQLMLPFATGTFRTWVPRDLHLLQVYFANQSLGLCTHSLPEAFSRASKQPFDKAVSYDPATGAVALRSRGATVMVVGCWLFLILLAVAIIYMAVSMSDLL